MITASAFIAAACMAVVHDAPTSILALQHHHASWIQYHIFLKNKYLQMEVCRQG